MYDSDQRGKDDEIRKRKDGQFTTESIQKLNGGIGRTEKRGDSGWIQRRRGETGDNKNEEIPKKRNIFSPRSRSTRAHQARLLVLQRALQFGVLQFTFVLPEESSSELGVGISRLACLLVEGQRCELDRERGGFWVGDGGFT